MKDYTSDGKVRFPLMVTEEEANALHALVDAKIAADAAPAAPAPVEPEPESH